jgi:hypothetical protein
METLKLRQLSTTSVEFALGLTILAVLILLAVVDRTATVPALLVALPLQTVARLAQIAQLVVLMVALLEVVVLLDQLPAQQELLLLEML